MGILLRHQAFGLRLLSTSGHPYRPVVNAVANMRAEVFGGFTDSCFSICKIGIQLPAKVAIEDFKCKQKSLDR